MPAIFRMGGYLPNSGPLFLAGFGETESEVPSRFSRDLENHAEKALTHEREITTNQI